VILELDRDGAQLFPGALNLRDLRTLQQLLPVAGRPGERIYGNPQVAAWLSDGTVGAIVRDALGSAAQPVRAILFDKTAETNWALGWHQDRTIAVRERAEAAGFSHWNTKAGAIHVEPPFGVIDRMLTARIHLDDVPSDNAPLRIAPGSHRLGRVEDGRIDVAVEECGQFACLAKAGDVWLYRTAILHASDRSKNDRSRRVLQADFSTDILDGGVEWLGVA